MIHMTEASRTSAKNKSEIGDRYWACCDICCEAHGVWATRYDMGVAMKDM